MSAGTIFLIVFGFVILGVIVLCVGMCIETVLSCGDGSGFFTRMIFKVFNYFSRKINHWN